MLLTQWATAVGGAIKKIPGVVDVLNGIENTISGPARTFSTWTRWWPRAPASPPQEVELDASAILQGEPATAPVVVNDRSYTIRVRFPHEAARTLDAIRNTLLVSGTGKTATLGSLAAMAEDPGQTEIRRDNLQRNVQVTARFEGMNLGDGMKKVQQAIADLKLPPEHPRAIRRAVRGAAEIVPGSAASCCCWPSCWCSSCCCSNSAVSPRPWRCSPRRCFPPAACSLALLVTGTTFNLSSFMGLIMVIGIVAKNGILLLDADQKFRADGMPAEESMIRAGERRLRPIMMTALATVAGMLPLALGLGAGSQMLQPLAIAVIGGILASMVLSLVVTPAVRYYLGPESNNG